MAVMTGFLGLNSQETAISRGTRMADNSDYASTQALIHRNILPAVALLQRLHSGRASEAGQNRGKIGQGLRECWSQPTPDEQLRSKATGSARTQLNTGAMSIPLQQNFFARSVHTVAPDLIGATLLFGNAGGVIVEVEAYHHTDPAAHSFRGRTARNAVMFGPPGFAYVYRSYGIHWCLNFVCEQEGSASAVLIRALEPSHGLAIMRRRRGLADERLLCSGPGRLCEALGIMGAHNGFALDRPPFRLLARDSEVEIV